MPNEESFHLGTFLVVFLMASSFSVAVLTEVSRVPADEVASGKGLPTEPFLKACSQLIMIFDVFGTAFALAKSDMNGNVEKITKAAQGRGYDTTGPIEQLVKFDMEEKIVTDSNSATCALLWLRRGLEFIMKLLELLEDQSLELWDCASKAYEATLAKHHGFATRQIFYLATKVLSTKQVFFETLATADLSVEAVPGTLANFRTQFTPVILHLQAFYQANGLDQA